MENSIPEDNTSCGISISALTLLELTSGELRGNGTGLRVVNNSHLLKWGSEPLRIGNNAGIGVELVSGLFYTVGGTIVENNRGPGFVVNTGIVSLGGVMAGGNIVSGNQG